MHRILGCLGAVVEGAEPTIEGHPFRAVVALDIFMVQVVEIVAGGNGGLFVEDQALKTSVALGWDERGEISPI